MEYFLKTLSNKERLMTEIYYQEKEATKPEIKFDAQSGIMKINGVSMPENATGTYLPAIQWLLKYKTHAAEKTFFTFKLSYLNTSSSKMIHEILKILDQIYIAGNEVLIHWYYDKNDSDMFEIGEEYADFTKTPFKLIAY